MFIRKRVVRMRLFVGVLARWLKVDLWFSGIESDSGRLVKILMLIGHGGEVLVFVIQWKDHCVYKKEES